MSAQFLNDTSELNPETFTELKPFSRAIRKVYIYPPPPRNDILCPGPKTITVQILKIRGILIFVLGVSN